VVRQVYFEIDDAPPSQHIGRNDVWLKANTCAV